MRHLNYASILTIATILSSCGGSSSSNSSVTTPAVNSAPVVDAGAAQTVDEGSTVQLAASATDADGDSLSYTWSQSSGPTITLSSTTVTNPTFSAPEVDANSEVVLTLSVSDGTATTTDDVTITVTNETTTEPTSGGWIVNTTNETSKQIMDGASFVEVDVLSVTQGTDFVSVETNSIPGYEMEVTQPILDWYNDYQPAAYSGSGGIALGNIIDFGEDVGLTSECDAGGNGWWPGGGGACADSEQNAIVDIPARPTEATDECATGAGPVGLWVNGVYIYNWTDTFSYNNEGVWNHYAVPFRSKGMDVCLGHAGGGQGQYHHHSYNECLRQEVGDDGSAHSTIYGYAGDGYPIYGPYEAENVLAKSCWIKRDYSADSETGCGTDGERSCQFVDPLDISQGIETVASAPSTADSVGIDYASATAVSGFYLEDYYYDANCTAQGEEYLDQYNGHEDAERGYHYHTSVDENMLPSFPLSPAIQYRGEAGGSFTCSTGNNGGGGMPPPPPGG